MAPAASLVWTVENTRWPVSDACDRDLRGLAVADLADHDDVGVVAQERAQARREGQVDLRVDLRLRDALELVLDRILDGEDVEVGRVDLGEAGVERRRLARAGRAGDQQDAVRPVDESSRSARGDRRRSRCRRGRGAPSSRSSRRMVMRSPCGGRRGGDAHVDVLAGDLAADAAVLRQPLLGDVEAGHDLHARDDRRAGTCFGRACASCSTPSMR